ncbi:hypothetical protein GCM10007216_13730 [Thalassobacillus devorans]|uniref:GH16 domain-containing protein n=2 Tax=Thalassobacillus devorans TaxID=279813 RepID=A0ABQ1NSH2_9BACI|nr:hypothetical protein GCM10007216_13730 [Thalassobacillus devorans]
MNYSFITNGWELVWHDEFSGNDLNSTYWNLENWPAEKNNELQYYVPQNVLLEDGSLKILSKREDFKGRNYTSGALHTKGKFSFLYGKAEIRAKLPEGQGLFPAFWMMPDKDNIWLPEIDILEMLGHKTNEIWMVLHWHDENKQMQNVSASYSGENYAEGFHTFGIEWSPERITWFIDGEERFTTSAFIPEEQMYLYLNTAIGGDWPGSPDETTVFPQYFIIDYVRVYKKWGGNE